jgi:rhodanese-related sulfurtransferase
MSTPVKHHSEGFLAIVHDAKKRITEITIDDYKRMREAGAPHILVDVREESEWNAAHAQGAIHLSKGIIERDIEKTVPDPSSRLVLYCGGGYRSALATDNLQKMGYRNVLSLDGGWRAIEASGLPLERNAGS